MIESPTAYSCSTCNTQIQTDTLYKEHFKSEFHRYNIKRRLINLPAATLVQYEAQFQHSTNKSASEPELRCQICSKSFLSANTYRHHINSTKHKKNRERLLKKESEKGLKKSKSASSSQFSVLSCDSEDKHQICIFCKKINTAKHLQEHNFPPFKESCIDIKGLKAKVTEIIKSGHCVFCSAFFQTPEAVKRHMEDVGHSMLNTQNLDEFSPYYVWTIQQESDSQSDDGSSQQAKKIPLNKLQDYYGTKIFSTKYGAKIRGKREIGVRRFKRYYKQYYREITKIDRAPYLALGGTPQTALQILHTFGKHTNGGVMNGPKYVIKPPTNVRKVRTGC